MEQIIKKTLFLLTAMLFLGCDVDELYESEINMSSVVTLSKGIAIHESSHNRIFYLKATPNSASFDELYQVEDGESLVWLKAGPNPQNATEIFALSAPVDERDTSRTEILLRINAESKSISRYTLGSKFDSLSFGPLGQFAILFHGQGNEGGEGLFNPNEVAFLDLSRAPTPATNPYIVSIPMGGRRINSISFIPELSVGGTNRQLAVFLAEGAIKIVDLKNPKGASAMVPLTAKDDTRSVLPVQVLARKSDELRDSMIYVLANGSQDIYAISLSANPEGPSELKATLNQFEAGGDPYDMVVVEDGATPLLTILSYANWSAGSIVNVVNIDTADAFTIEIDDSVNRAMLRGGAEAQEIVLYGDNSSGVHFLKVDGLGQEKGRNLDDLFIPDGVSHAISLDINRLLLVPRVNQDLILLNLEERKSTRLSSHMAHNWDSAQIFKDRFFFLPESKNQIDVVDLNTGHPDSLLLDDEARSLHLLKGSDTGVVLHNTASGRVTIFPLSNPTRGKALVADGLWLDEFLDETEVPK